MTSRLTGVDMSSKKKAVDLIATQQPVAGDLRALIAKIQYRH